MASLDEAMIPEVDEERMITVIDAKKDVPELVVGKRSRVSLQYIVSPFMTEMKRRFIDRTYPNLFRKVDHAK